MRYHSLILEEESTSRNFEISARTNTGEIMGIRHKIFSFDGLQFHPESILTRHGEEMIKNWLKTI